MYTTCTDIMYMCWVCVWKLLAILIVHLYIRVAFTSSSSRRRIVGPSYKRMAMARNVNSKRYTDLLRPLVPGSFIQVHCHGTPCKQQEV